MAQGTARENEIRRVRKALRSPLRYLLIKFSSELSYSEFYAAAIEAIEDLAHAPSAKIHDEAREVCAKCDATWPERAP
jgi:hypothetical protein